ncbi:MAG: DUF3857 domain-containing protein [Kofleriaceae bacterium]
MRGMVGLCIAVAAWLVAPVGAGAGPLDNPAFSATPAEILAAAVTAPRADDGIAILREDVSISVDAGGLLSRRTRLVFVVQTPAAADAWGTLTLGWQPFYQDTPSIAARVISPDGKVARLDPALIHEAPAVNESPTVFSDRRVMSAPLPRLAVGAVVEEEIVTTNRAPLLAAGEVRWEGVTRSAPIAHKVVEVSWPAARPVTLVTRGPGVPAPARRASGGRTVVRYEFRDVAVPAAGQPAVPSDYVSTPYLGLSTGRSWQAVAAEYRDLVEAKLAQGVALPAELRAATQRATVDKIMAWLHARVRYTGIELSDSAIIPFTPAETLARGFGDCKDKATLTVSLLRAAGITADVALVSTGPGFDVDPALAGLGDFNHAIVRAVVDGQPLWIDATEDLLPAGQLPTRDQGRRALVIAAATTALTTTPVGRPADNVNREVRTFHLTEAGRPTVTEVSTQAGVWASDLRGWVRGNTRADVHRQLSTYVDQEYLGDLRSFSSTDPNDLATPFALTLEVDDVGRVATLRAVTKAWLFPRDVLDHLPDTLTSTASDIADRVAARTVDYVWSVPQTFEIVNQLVVPPGYRIPPAPANTTRRLGTMTLSTTHARQGQVVTVTYRLDTGKQRITAAELRATRAAIAALNQEPAEVVELPLEAAALKDDGKLQAAAAAYRRLVALHPREAIHHGQLAQLYLDAGLGEAARREARLATTLEPTDADAWMVLGFVLNRDLFGRRFEAGLDRAGALAAYRKAVQLNPRHIGAVADLADVLVTDAAGHLRSDPDACREAAPLLESVRDSEGSTNDVRLQVCYAIMGDAEALVQLARRSTDVAVQRSATVLAVALGGDAAATIRRADALASGDTRTKLLEDTLGTLAIARRYEHLAPLLRAMTPTPLASELAQLTALRRLDLGALAPLDPTTPAKLASVAIAGGLVPTRPWSDKLEAALTSVADLAYLQPIRGYPAQLRGDTVLAGASAATTPLGPGRWRVTIKTVTGVTLTWYVARRGRRVEVVGSPMLASTVGAAVLDALQAKDVPAARAWLLAMADDAQTPEARVSTMVARHRADIPKAGPALLELLAMFTAEPDDDRVTLAALRACAGLTAPADTAACGLFVAILAPRRGVTDPLRDLLTVTSTDPDVVADVALGRARAGAIDDAHKLLDDALARHPGALPLLSARVTIDARGTPAELEPWLAALTVAGAGSAMELSNVAWVRAFHDADLTAARAVIERSVGLGQAPSATQHNTFAAVLAAQGELAAAAEHLRQTLALRAPTDADWYVVGRIAEGLGLVEDAVVIYRRLTRPPRRPLELLPWDFAQRRLTALGQPAGRW